jgi:TRAP-type uncharacterized transport system substrate-binding protein
MVDAVKRAGSWHNARLEPLPKGANFARAKMLWEIGLDVAGDIDIPYGGNRDMRISVGSGGGDIWKPSLNLATGSAILAHDVCRGAIDMAFVNPSALLTQAYRGVGLYDKKLPVRVVCSYPSWDSFAMVVHPRTGLRTVRDIKERQYPLKLSVREDPTHSTVVLIEQMFRLDGFSLDELTAWGGQLVTTGGPGGATRMQPLKAGTLDAVFDEGLIAWLDEALGAGYHFLDFTPGSLKAMTDLGWRQVALKPGDYPHITREYACLDFSGWPIYCCESLDEKVVIDVCEAVVARQHEIPWTEGDYRTVAQVFSDSRETPIDVPLHPGVEKFLRDRFGKP